MSNNNIPKDGIAGLKENFSSDALSGFIVFLLAMPLSLGIAKASDFPPIMGLITAMVGGILVSLIAGSKLTIKGPAAGLIVIVAGAVSEFGAGNATTGWHLALGAVVVAGVLQVLFGILKFGKLSDFFPFAAVEGMLAAIGLIILSKQIHILLGVNPVNELGKPLVEPIDLFSAIPHTFVNINATSAIIGLISLTIVLFYPLIKHPLTKKIPAPLIVLLVAIPLGIVLNLKTGNPKGLLQFDKGLIDALAINVSFAGLSQVGVFVKYVIMFALVGSLEALLTVKAIDNLDPYKRKSDYNKDLIAVGVGNIIAGTLGGLPMISEVARSSNNVGNGAKTRWANFFHGVFIMIFLLFAVSFSNLIPSSALAAMLIGVGIKLAHPRVFKHMAHIGKEQLIIFIVTILFTLLTDLLIGIAAGIFCKIIIHMVNGGKLTTMFKNPIAVSEDQGIYTIALHNDVVFTNIIKLKNEIEAIPLHANITLVVDNATLIDHTTMSYLDQYSKYYRENNGTFEIIGLDGLTPYSHDKLAARKKSI